MSSKEVKLVNSKPQKGLIKNAQNVSKKKKFKHAMSMLEYCKLLLSKVYFDQELLKKEYQKGLQYLNPNDQAELKRWLHLNQNTLNIKTQS